MGGALGLGSERGELSGCARRSGAYDARSATRLSSVFNTVHGLQLEQVRTHFTMVTRLILALSALFSLGVHASAQVPFDECGVLVPGVTCPNFFQTPNGNMYLLDGYSGYQHGDTVRVQGAFDAGCITFCLQGLGCVSVTSITSCSTTSSVTPYCFGDGSGASCPCGNSSSSGLGCANSSGAGAGLSASGSDSLSADDLALSASGVVANQPGFDWRPGDHLRRRAAVCRWGRRASRRPGRERPRSRELADRPRGRRGLERGRLALLPGLVPRPAGLALRWRVQPLQRRLGDLLPLEQA